MKALLVEDDYYYAARIREFLLDNEIEVSVARNVQDALKTNLKDVDVILVDIGLPNDPSESGISSEDTRAGFMSGVALCREFRRLGNKLPIILLSSEMVGGEAYEWAKEQNIPFVFKDEGPKAIIGALAESGIILDPQPPLAFIVHGHDEASLMELKDYLQNTLKWQEPLVLREQPSHGKTIIEKFEEQSNRVDCVFALLTPDDVGKIFLTNDDKRRARQNVIFELGFFYAQMGRKSGRVFALCNGPLEIPSDLQGVIWIDISKGIKAAGEDIRREVAHILR
jgi:CheY-like chemotaxis protein